MADAGRASTRAPRAPPATSAPTRSATLGIAQSMIEPTFKGGDGANSQSWPGSPCSQPERRASPRRARLRGQRNAPSSDGQRQRWALSRCTRSCPSSQAAPSRCATSQRVLGARDARAAARSRARAAWPARHLPHAYFSAARVDVAAFVERSGCKEGVVTVLSKHSTVGITINEMEPRFVDDVRQFLLKLAPPQYPYLHNDLDYRRARSSPRRARARSAIGARAP